MLEIKPNVAVTSEPRSFVVLDTFRGLAAFYVLLFHASAFLGPRREMLGGVLTWGVEVVLFFFVLSGFCIHFSQARALSRSPDAVLDVKRFARRRFWRIYPPFLGAICLTFAVDHIGLWLNPSFYADLHISLGQVSRTATWSGSTLVGNLLCFQPGVPTYGSNGPLWSLGYEAIFYAVYPAYFQLSKRLGPVWTLVTALGASAASLIIFKVLGPRWVVPFGVLSAWGIWAMGGTLAEIAAKRLVIKVRWPVLAAGLILLFACASRRIPWPNAVTQNYAWGTAWALLLFWTSQSGSAIGARIRARLSAVGWTGRVSYSLYLAHAPVVTLLLALTARGTLGTLSPTARFLAAVTLGTMSGLLLYFTVERYFSGAERRQVPAEVVPSAASVAQAAIS